MNTAPSRSARAAFSLVEITLALGIMAFCLVALLGLLPLGNTQNFDANKATAVTAMAGSVIAELRSMESSGLGPTPTPSPLYRVNFPVPPGSTETTSFYVSETGEYLGQADTGGAVPLNARFQVKVRLTSPPSTQPMGNKVAYLRLSQPANQAPDTYPGATEIVTVLEH